MRQNWSEDDEMSEPSARHSPSISRRGLLLGSAGLTVGSAVLAGPALAQQTKHEMDMAAVSPKQSGSNRLYSVNQVNGVVDIAHDPTDIPQPLARSAPQTVRVDLETVELEARLDERTTYPFWTFNGRVPGPFVRVRVGDTVEVHLKNNENSSMMHNVDFHAAIGPGGGAGATSANPGEEKSFSRRSSRDCLSITALCRPWQCTFHRACMG